MHSLRAMIIARRAQLRDSNPPRGWEHRDLNPDMRVSPWHAPVSLNQPRCVVSAYPKFQPVGVPDRLTGARWSAKLAYAPFTRSEHARRLIKGAGEGAVRPRVARRTFPLTAAGLIKTQGPFSFRSVRMARIDPFRFIHNISSHSHPAPEVSSPFNVGDRWGAAGGREGSSPG